MLEDPITPSKKAVTEYQEIYKKQYGKELNDQEAFEQASNLLNFFRVLANIEYRDRLRKKRLKKEPQGFHLSDDGVYNCPICYREISGKTTWYDSCGFKCLDYQRALDKKVIPKYIFRDNDSWLDSGGREPLNPSKYCLKTRSIPPGKEGKIPSGLCTPLLYFNQKQRGHSLNNPNPLVGDSLTPMLEDIKI